MQGERYSPSLEPFCIQHNKEKVMPDAVVVRRHKEKPRGKESGAVGAKGWVEVVATIYSAWLYAIQASCASRRTGQKLAADTTTGTGLKPTLQNLSLPNVRLACALQGTPVHEIQDHAVGKFLAILVRWVGCAEVAEMESLDNSLLVVFRRTEDEVAQGVNLNPSSFPELHQVSVKLVLTLMRLTRVSGNWMFRSPTCTGGGGSRRDAREVERMSFSGSAKLLFEFFHGIADMEEDMRLNILLVRDFFSSFLSFLSSLLSSPSWLCTDLDSLMRRPKALHVLSDEAREGALLGSRECEDEGGGEAGSGLPRVGLLGVMVAFW